MADTDAIYVAMLTDAGAAALAKAIATKTTLKITRMAVGDGNGSTPLPSKLQKKLIHEVFRVNLNRLSVESGRPVIVAEGILQPEVGGWWVREVGLYDDTGVLIAVASYPATFKPLQEQGSGRTQVIRLLIQVSSTANVQILQDPNTVTATLAVVQEAISQGEAATARALATERTISLKGDAAGAAKFNGAGDAAINVTLANSGVQAGTYSKVRVSAKGLVLEGAELTAADIPSLDATKITTGTLSRPTTGNAGSATRLQTPRLFTFDGDVGGQAQFDGAKDVAITLSLGSTGVQAGTYSKVRVSAKGLVLEGAALTAADIPSLDATKITTGTLSRPTTGNAGSATKLQTGRTLSFTGDATGQGVFDGSQNLSIALSLAGMDVSKLVSGILPIHRGGTGGNTPDSARTALNAAVRSQFSGAQNGFYWDTDNGFMAQWGRLNVGDLPSQFTEYQVWFHSGGFSAAPFIVIPVIYHKSNPGVPAATLTPAIMEGKTSGQSFNIMIGEWANSVQDFALYWFAIGFRAG